MRKSVLFLVILLAASVSAFGNIVIANPGGSGSWYTMPAPSETPANAFWDNQSKDGGRCNVGYWLNSASWAGMNCDNSQWQAGGFGPGVGNLEFYASSSTPSAPAGWFMQATGPNAVTLQLEVAGNRDANTFGYYTLTPDGIGGWTVNTPMTELFNGTANPNSSAGPISLSVAAGDRLGFYLCPAAGLSGGMCGPGNANAFLSSTPFDGSAVSGTGQLALFREINPTDAPAGVHAAFWIGVEDEADSGLEGTGDYNDFVVRLTAVPEPGFYGVLAIGMSALFLAVRRRRKA